MVFRDPLPGPVAPAGERPVLPLGRYRFQFLAEDPVAFPAYSGSTWRGVFGRALKRAVCVTRAPTCEGCLLHRSCVYPYVFETPGLPEAAKMRRYNAVPHPYVLDPRSSSGRTFVPGETVDLGLTLLGRANAHLPYLIHALARAGERGIGRGRGRLKLDEVWQEHSEDRGRIYQNGGTLEAYAPEAPRCPPPPVSARIVIHSPLRLKREERLVGPEDFRFADLFASLLRRASMLTCFHTDTPLETDFAGLMRLAREVSNVKVELRWHELTRYSSRQKTQMAMGGLIGTIELQEGDWGPFWPYLWLGQWMHAGKSATMGLGCYTIETASLPARTEAPG